MPKGFWSSPLLWIALTLAAMAVIGVLSILSGLYSVSANKGHWRITYWILEVAMQRSVATHSLGNPDPPALNRDLARLGGGHYAVSCAPCHGGPGLVRNPMVGHMLPSPPLLADTAPDRSDDHLFWVVKNGVKFTGMPGWITSNRPDEVWSLVAFLRLLPELDARGYGALTGAPLSAIAPPPGLPSVLAGCARCHDSAAAPAASRWIPRLGGQPAPYLLRALREYADGTRTSGIMVTAIAGLSDDDFRALSRFYAAQVPLRRDIAATPGAQGLGQRIATEGIAEAEIPPCRNCHHAQASPQFPRLEGQSAVYIANQLRLWQQGERARTAPGQIMAPVAKRLTPAQIAAVAAFFERGGADP